MSFVDNGDGTATLAGTPDPGTAGSYPLTITASNGVGSDATQSFTLTVSNELVAPAITSGASTTFIEGSAGTFTVTSTGSPTPAVSETGTLPAGVSFVDNGDGTATLAGTPDPGTAGSYPLTITASNGVGSDATQSFTLTVNAAPAITSGASTTFTEGSAGTFAVTSTGSPTPSVTETGSLPSGVTFVSNGDGTATLAGTPGAGTAGSYPLTITASNGVGSDATQGFTLTVNAAAAGGFTGKVQCHIHGTVNFKPHLTATSASTITFKFSASNCLGQNGTSLKQGSPPAKLLGGTATFVLPPASSYSCPTVEADLSTPPALSFTLNWRGKPTSVSIPASAVSLPPGTLQNTATAFELVYSGGAVTSGSFHNGGTGAAALQLNLKNSAVQSFLTSCTTAKGAKKLVVSSGTITLGS